MDLQQAGSDFAPAGRTESFHNGVSGTPSMVASGLADESQQFNDKVGRGFTPHSVLQGFSGMSGNGMSSEEAGRLLPGGMSMGTPNGSSPESYDQSRMLRFVSHTDEV